MKNKSIIFLMSILLFFYVPIISRAVLNGTDANLTIVIDTYGQIENNVRFIFTDDFYYIPDSTSWSGEWQIVNLGPSTISQINVPVHSASLYKLVQYAQNGNKPKNIVCTSDNPNETYNYIYDEFGISFGPTIPGENIVCRFNEYRTLNPVLIVPGLLGTEMKNGEELLWADISRMAISASDDFMDPLAFNKDLTPSEPTVAFSDVIREKDVSVVKLFDYTEGLINEFKNQGYVEDENIFTFPYDWRYGVTGKFADGKTNVDLLAQKIQDIMAQTGASKVDVVAHSTGGLVVKKYVADHPASHHIGKAVFVGVPNIGAPKAIKALLQGDNFGINFGPVGLNDQEMKKIAANMPSAYDLLPSQAYYNVAGSPISQVDIGYGLGVSEPTQKDLNYGEFAGYLNDKGLNLTANTNSENLHTTAFDNFDLRTAGINLYAIDGCKTATMTNILEVSYKDALGNYHTDYDNIKLKTGDGTVPFESSTNLPIDPANKFYDLTADHSKMLSANGSRQKIVNLLSGSNLLIGDNLITQDINECQLNGKAISVFSPIDISVIDQNGNRLGLADDGSVVNEIPNADFEVMGEHKFLYLPQDAGQNYSINLQGTDTGTYTVKSQNITNSQITNAEIFDDLPVTPLLTGQINIGQADSATTLSVKQNPSDSPTTILPSKVLDYSADKTPPEAIIKFDVNSKDLRFVGTDNLSDIFSISIANNGSVVTLKDEAGNTTELNFKERNRRTAMSAEITSIKYNGTAINMGSNLFSYSWSFDKSGNLAKLTQKVKERNDYSITAVYDGVNTKLTGTTSAGRISQSFPGLKIVKVTTNKGDLGWSY